MAPTQLHILLNPARADIIIALTNTWPRNDEATKVQLKRFSDALVEFVENDDEDDAPKGDKYRYFFQRFFQPGMELRKARSATKKQRRDNAFAFVLGHRNLIQEQFRMTGEHLHPR